MEKLLVKIIIIFSIIPSLSNAQHVADNQFSKIENFTKVWGFLKYYHPQINKGNIDWDSIYLKYLPEISKSSNKGFNQKLLNIIDELGEIEQCQTCENISRYPENWTRNLSFDWIKEDSILTKELKDTLLHIFENRYQGEGFYCSYAWGEAINRGPIKFINEKDYSDSLIINDYRYRLLTLARFWNAVEYFFAYKYLLEDKWDCELQKYIPILLNETSLTEYHLNITRLTREVEDSHSGTGHSRYLLRNLWSKKPPFDIHTINNKTYISDITFDSLNSGNNIMVGDEILAINDKSIIDARSEMLDLCKASNDKITTRSIDAQLLFGNSDKLNLKILRDGNKLDVEVTRYPFRSYWDYNEEVSPALVTLNNVAIINLSLLNSENQIDSIMDIAILKEAIILDLRTNPMFDFRFLGAYFSNVLHYGFQAYEPSLIDRGIFKPAIKQNIEFEKKQIFNGRIIIIVNEYTQSYGESIAMFFQTLPNTIVVGSKTSGANGNTTRILLPGNISARFSNIIIEYPDGQQSQKNGIKIDHMVSLKVDDIKNQTDPYIETAIDLIN